MIDLNKRDKLLYPRNAILKETGRQENAHQNQNDIQQDQVAEFTGVKSAALKIDHSEYQPHNGKCDLEPMRPALQPHRADFNGIELSRST